MTLRNLLEVKGHSPCGHVDSTKSQSQPGAAWLAWMASTLFTGGLCVYVTLSVALLPLKPLEVSNPWQLDSSRRCFVKKEIRESQICLTKNERDSLKKGKLSIEASAKIAKAQAENIAVQLSNQARKDAYHEQMEKYRRSLWYPLNWLVKADRIVQKPKLIRNSASK